MWGSPPGNKVDFIKRALENEKAKVQEAVYIGDMVEDFRIAQRIGVMFVGRRDKESFGSLNIPEFPDMLGIIEWIKNK